jgi:hypothetical protein
MRAARDSAGNGSTGAGPAGIEAGANRRLAEMEAVHEQNGGKKFVIEQYTANAGAPPEWRHGIRHVASRGIARVLARRPVIGVMALTIHKQLQLCRPRSDCRRVERTMVREVWRDLNARADRMVLKHRRIPCYAYISSPRATSRLGP